MGESDTDFDIRDTVTLDQLDDDEAKNEEEQEKVIAHIKKSQDVLITHERELLNETREDLEKQFNRFKAVFGILIKELIVLQEEIDHISIQIEISLRRNDVDTIHTYNEKLKEKRLLIRDQINELNNNIYNNTTTIFAKLLNR